LQLETNFIMDGLVPLRPKTTIESFWRSTLNESRDKAKSLVFGFVRLYFIIRTRTCLALVLEWNTSFRISIIKDILQSTWTYALASHQKNS